MNLLSALSFTWTYFFETLSSMNAFFFFFKRKKRNFIHLKREQNYILVFTVQSEFTCLMFPR